MMIDWMVVMIAMRHGVNCNICLCLKKTQNSFINRFLATALPSLGRFDMCSLKARSGREICLLISQLLNRKRIDL
jgi:hypothetical protein